jgi:hypothetical protein
MLALGEEAVLLVLIEASLIMTIDRDLVPFDRRTNFSKTCWEPSIMLKHWLFSFQEDTQNDVFSRFHPILCKLC